MFCDDEVFGVATRDHVAALLPGCDAAEAGTFVSANAPVCAVTSNPARTLNVIANKRPALIARLETEAIEAPAAGFLNWRIRVSGFWRWSLPATLCFECMLALAVSANLMIRSSLLRAAPFRPAFD